MPDSYLEMAARDTYFWAWPMTNVYDRRLAFKDLPHAGLLGGTVPVGPPGFMLLALDQSPVVVQVPDFGDRFWV
jgi:hypothetical protein